MKPVRILFFIAGVSPSDEELAAAEKLGVPVAFRNAKAVPTEAHSLEVCDGVAGKVPTIYADAFPKAEAAIAARAKELEALAKRVGDAPAPKPAAKPQASPQAAPKAEGSTQGKAPAWKPNN